MQQNNTKILDEISNAQCLYHDRFGLGFNHTEKGLSSMITEGEVEKKTYVEVTRGSTKKEKCKISNENTQEIERTQEEDYKRMTPPKRFRIQSQQPSMEINQE